MARSRHSVFNTRQVQALQRFLRGDYAGAIEAWESMLHLLGHTPATRFARALCFYNIGMAYLRLELPYNAAECLRQALHLSACSVPLTRAQRLFRADAHYLLAQAYEMHQQPERANDAYHLACHAYEEVGDLRRKAEALLKWANLLECQGELIWAANLYNMARRTAWSLREEEELAMEAEQAVERVLKLLTQAD